MQYYNMEDDYAALARPRTAPVPQLSVSPPPPPRDRDGHSLGPMTMTAQNNGSARQHSRSLSLPGGVSGFLPPFDPVSASQSVRLNESVEFDFKGGWPAHSAANASVKITCLKI